MDEGQAVTVRETPKIALTEIIEHSDDEICTLVQEGQLDVIVDSALSEWGSKVEKLFNKLEHCVPKWHQKNVSKSVSLHFIEPNPETPEQPDEE